MSSSGCLSETEIELWINRRVSESTRSRYEQHCERCESCQSRLEQVKSTRILDSRIEASTPESLHTHAIAFDNEAGPSRTHDLTEGVSSLVTVDKCDDKDTELDLPECIDGYTLLDRIGTGGFSVVYSAKDTRDGSVVAIKLITKGTGVASDAEALTLKSLDHPSIVRVIRSGIYQDSRRYLAMELVDGASLAGLLTGEPHPPDHAVKLVAQVAKALHYAHTRGFVHRDVKPGNILVDSSGNAKVSDFGLAIHDDEQWEHQHEIAGTKPYMSPEQVRRESHRLDGRTDIWSLGVVFYEMLTGKRPFKNIGTHQLYDEILHREPKPPRQIIDSIPAQLENICLRCLAKSMTDRYRTALDLAEDLESWAQQEETAKSHGIGRELSSTANDSVFSEESAFLVPRGLRSFDWNDAEYFLRLLPGPRHRDGLPDSVRFWVSKVKSRAANETFAVGLIYGPSGCGKTSFVQAGVVPLVRPETVVVFLEATEKNTEPQLLQSLRQQFPFLEKSDSLVETLRKVRVHAQGESKVVIVIDQFEQYLNGVRETQDANLPDALRQCDGGNLQCLLVVRDDFWMPISEFMRRLEIPLIEGANSLPLPLFSVSHAIRVLTNFGYAYGRLPKGDLAPKHLDFIESAVHSMVEEGHVICLRLSLFAHLTRNREWIPETLQQLGGLEGLGVLFLDDSFRSTTAPPENRRHFEAACKVLSCMMPIHNETIRGERKTRRELSRASGYADGSPEMEELLRILDKDLRLITPIAIEGSEAHESTPEPYFQLSHDFLVPALRHWLDLRSQTTLQGRATARLILRDSYWRLRPENRQLPSLWETINILLFTRRSRWTLPQRSMMRAASKFHCVRALAVAVPLFAVLLGISVNQRQSKSMEMLLECKADVLEATMDQVASLSWILMPALREKAYDTTLAPEKRLRSALALARYGQLASDVVIELLAEAPTEYDTLLINALRRDAGAGEALKDHFTRMTGDGVSPDHRAVLALVALSLGEPTPAEMMLDNDADPSERAHFLDLFAERRVSVDEVVGVFMTSSNPRLRSALGIGLGRLAAENLDLPKAQVETIQQALQETFQSTPHAPVRSAVEFAIRKLELPLSSTVKQSQDDHQAEWFSTPSGRTMIRIPNGTLAVTIDGSTHSIDIDEFFLDSREVSRELFEAFIAESDLGPSLCDERVSPTPEHAANSVSYMDALRFANWLSHREGFDAYYRVDGDAWELADSDGQGYRLPSESEWEFACRANSSTTYGFGNDPRFLEQYATYGSSLTSSICGTRIPNAWGLFDMHGNVWEWCRRDARMAQPNELDSAEIERFTSIIRGGGYDNPAQILRSDNRVTLGIHEKFNGIGFRLARTLRPSHE